MTTGILVTLGVGFLCLALFLALLLQGDRGAADGEVAPAPLPGLSTAHLENAEIVFAARNDYRKVREKPELAKLARRFRRDRRVIVSMWLRELQRDIWTVRDFRRFLVLNGLPVRLRDELAIGLAASGALLYLQCLRALVFVFGPFILIGAVRSAGLPVQYLSRRGARLLDRVPSTVRAQIRQRWADRLVNVRRA